MEEWQTRVVAERDELAGKLDRLTQFLAAPKDASGTDMILLRQQHMAMSTYLGILNQRIARFA